VQTTVLVDLPISISSTSTTTDIHIKSIFSKPYNCELCRFNTCDKQNFTHHKNNFHNKTCNLELCNHQFHDKCNSNHNKTYVCPHCSLFETNWKSNLNRHINNVHATYYCLLCKYSMLKKDILKHIDTVHILKDLTNPVFDLITIN
jgi:hypothetical protein